MHGRPTHRRHVTATVAITVATVIVSAMITLSGQTGLAAVAAGFVPGVATGTVGFPPEVTIAVPWWLTPLSATLVHANFIHLALNMAMLVICGRDVERALGAWGVVVLYLVGAYGAALGQWIQGPNSATPMIGASGAISAIIAAYALMFGQSRARAIGPITARAVNVMWLAAAWVGIQLLIGVVGLAGGPLIAIGAHIGGFGVGLALARPLLLWRYRRA